jgi:hypothetical protein
VIAPVTPGLLSEVFTPEQIVRVPASLQGEHITHQETRRYLAEVGLPLSEKALCEIREDLGSGLVPLRDRRDTSKLEAYPGYSPEIGGWVHLGRALYSDIALDGKTGIVYQINDEISTIPKVHTDLSSLAYGTYVLERRKADYDSEDFPEIDDLIQVAEQIQEEISRVDPAPFADGDGVWDALVTDMSGGMW